jgi:hypothetical protein
MVNIQQTSNGLLGVYFDANLIFNYQFVSSINGSTGLRAYNSPNVQFFSWYLNTDVYTIDDPTINDFIEDCEQHIYDRTRKFYNQQTVTELYDFRDQWFPEMPYVLTRSFNTLPSWSYRYLFKESTIQLKSKPVLNVVSVEENIGSDGSTDNWVLRTQGRGNDYVVYCNEGLIVFVNNYPHNGHQNLRVIYSVGEPAVPKNVRRYCALLAAEMYLSGFGSPATGIKDLKEDVRKQILRQEEYIPRATLLGSPAGTMGGNDSVVVV